MRSLVLVLLLAFSYPAFAEEVKFSGADWDNLAIPLGIPAFYLNVDSAAKAKSVTLELDLYDKGTFVRTIQTAAISYKEGVLKLNAAIYFPTEKNTEGQCVLDWNNMRSLSKFTISASEFPAYSGCGSGVMNGKISAPGRMPVFQILAGTQGFAMGSTVEATLKGNPKASILIGYLKLE